MSVEYSQHRLDYLSLTEEIIKAARLANADGIAPAQLLAQGHEIIYGAEYYLAGNYTGKIIQAPYLDKPDAEGRIAAAILHHRGQSKTAQRSIKKQCYDLVARSQLYYREKMLKKKIYELKFNRGINDEIDPNDIPTVAKLGDVWELGNHRIICADNADSKFHQFIHREPTAILTDPPYLIDYTKSRTGGRIRKRIKIQGDSKIDKISIPFNLLPKKPGNRCLVFMGMTGLGEAIGVVKNEGLRIDTLLIWDKRRGSTARTEFKRGVEYVIVASRAGGGYNKTDGTKQAPFLLRVARSHKNHFHPTQKPIKLVERLIRFYIPGRDIILDPYLGGGSTLLAAEKQGRICIGYELEPHYADVSIVRWEKLTGQKAKKING